MTQATQAEGTRPASPAKVFFSYSHVDKAHAVDMIEEITAAGHDVWWDGRLEGGTTFATSIEQALEAADVVVVLWSQASVTSHWVKDEAESGQMRGKLVPLCLDGVRPPLGFRQVQAIDMSRWAAVSNKARADTPALAELLRAITRLAQGGLAPDLPDSTPLFDAATPIDKATHGGPEPQSASRRAILIGLGTGAGAVLAGGGLWTALKPEEGAPGNSVAVLPFENQSQEEKLGFVTRGLASEIRAYLARNPALRVLAGTTSRTLANQGGDTRKAALALGVSYLLEGSLQVLDGQATLLAALVDGRSGFQRWSGRFTYRLDDLLSIKDLIAQKITAELTAGMPGQGMQKGDARDPVAFSAYLRGQQLYSEAIDTAGDLAALERFEAAIAADPAFALAHAARAQSLTILGNTAASAQKADGYYAQAAVSAQRAVELGPELADAHSTLGYVLFQAQLKVADAKAPYAQSRKLGDGNALVLARYAGYCAATRQHEAALVAIKRAIELDPLNPTIHRALGFVHFANRDFAQSMRHVRRALQLNVNMPDGHARLGMALLYLAKPNEALEACAPEPSGMMRYPCTAIAQYKLGDQAAAEQAQEALVKVYGDAGLYQQAQIAAQWGAADQALTLLEHAFDLKDSGLTYLAIDPALDPLRSKPRFQALSAALGFGQV